MVQNLFPNHLHHLKARQAADRVHQHVPVNPNKVLAVQDAVLILARSVDNFRRIVLPLVPNLFAKGVFDGGVVRLDKVPIYVADRERGFTCGRGVLEREREKEREKERGREGGRERRKLTDGAGADNGDFTLFCWGVGGHFCGFEGGEGMGGGERGD